MLELLNNMGSGLLKDELGSVKKQIQKMLAARGVSVAEFQQRIKFLPLANRSLSNHIFTLTSDALLNRRQLRILYRSYKHQQSQRTISPQSLIYYRENWYVGMNRKQGGCENVATRVPHVRGEE